MNKLRYSQIILFFAFLSACSSTTQNEEQAAVVNPLEKGKAFKIQRAKEQFFYSANGIKYRLQTTWDGLLKARITVINVEEGTAFTGGGNESSEVQNLIRDAFRSEGLCENGEHPGLLDFGYVFDPNNFIWAARVRCSDTFQKNV